MHRQGLLAADEVIWLGRQADSSTSRQIAAGEDVMEKRIQEEQAPIWAELERLQAELAQAFESWPTADPAAPECLDHLRWAKDTAAACLQLGWTGLYLGREDAAAKVLSSVRVLICTTDWLIKQSSASASSAGKTLLSTKPLAFTLTEEVQRTAGDVLVTLAAISPEVLCLGDGGQEVYYPKPPPTCPWDWQHGRGVGFRTSKLHAHDFLTQSDANLQTLSTCKRCGITLVKFMRCLEPKRLQQYWSGRFSDTTIAYRFFSGNSWWAKADVVNGLPESEGDAVMWNDMLFKNLVSQILEDLEALQAELQAEQERGHMLVLVLFFLQRTAGPFRQYLYAVLQHADVTARLGSTPARLQAAVQVRLAAQATGLTARRAHVIRHRRFKNEDHVWRGAQVNRNLRYIAFTRATDSVTLWLEHRAEPGQLDVRNVAELQDRVGGQEDAADLQRMDQVAVASLCEELQLAFQWNLEMVEVASVPVGFARGILNRVAEAIWGPALFNACSVLTDDLTISDAMALLSRNVRASVLALSVPVGDLRYRAWDATALRSPVLHFGAGSWPTVWRSEVCGTWAETALRTGPLLLNAVTVKLTGPFTAQVCLPLLCDWPGEPPYPGRQAPEGCEVLRSLACAIWYTHDWLRALLRLEDEDLCLRSKTHKATVRTDGAETFFVKACESDREAVMLAPTSHMVDAEEWGGPDPPPPPKKYMFYMYIGGGVSGQPAHVYGLVLRTKSRVLTLASFLTATILGRSSPDGHFPAIWSAKLVAGLYDPKRGVPQDAATVFLHAFHAIARAWDEDLLKEDVIDPSRWATCARKFFREGFLVDEPPRDREDLQAQRARLAYGDMVALDSVPPEPDEEAPAPGPEVPGPPPGLGSSASAGFAEPQSPGDVGGAPAAPATAEAEEGTPPKRRRTVKLGFDVGGVILAQGQGSVLVDGCIQHMTHLQEVFGRNSLWIISRVNSDIAATRSLKSLDRVGVLGPLVPLSQVHFSSDYAGVGGKGLLCKQYGLDAFVDDKVENLNDIAAEASTCKTILFESGQSSQPTFRSHDHVTVNGWAQLYATLETMFSAEDDV